MIRTLNFLVVAMTGLACLGLYRIAEETRVARAELIETQRTITAEQQRLAVLETEWAGLVAPARIEALAARHLDLSDAPALALSSLAQLPRRGDAPLLAETAPLRAAKVREPARVDAPAVTQIAALDDGV